MTKEEIGAILKQLRTQSGLTQKQVAEKIGRKQQIVGHWETGYAQPDADTLFTLCDIYGVSVDTAFGFSTPTDLDWLTKKFRALDAHGKKLVTMVLDTEYDRVSEKKIVQTIRETPLCQYPYIIGGASAGATSFMTDVEMETIQAPVMEGADFIISVSGDSMEPDFYDGDRVYVKKTPDLDTGDIGIFMIDGSEIYIKELGSDGLISHNPKSDYIILFNVFVWLCVVVCGLVSLVNLSFLSQFKAVSLVWFPLSCVGWWQSGGNATFNFKTKLSLKTY